jgi:hypothetical protein
MTDDRLARIVLPEVTLPIGQTLKGTDCTGLWANYEALAKAGITTLTVRPEMEILDFSYFEEEPPETDRKLALHFDPTVWDTSKYGLIYTDPVFEDAFEKWFHSLGFPPEYGSPHYTEQGMQGDDHVSMEMHVVRGSANWWSGFDDLKDAIKVLETIMANGAKVELFRTGTAHERMQLKRLTGATLHP